VAVVPDSVLAEAVRGAHLRYTLVNFRPQGQEISKIHVTAWVLSPSSMSVDIFAAWDIDRRVAQEEYSEFGRTPSKG
jgi:hypothetical protein